MCMKDVDIYTDALINELGSISRKEADGHVEYDLEQGHVITWTLKKNQYIEVIDALLTEDTIFPLHEHDLSFETMVMYTDGDVTVVCDEPGCEPMHKKLVKGEPFGVPPGVNHFLHAKKSSWILATLIPPDAGMK